MFITNNNVIRNLIIGSTFLGTGGGGSPEDAKKIYRTIQKTTRRIELQSIHNFQSDDLFITAFSVGSLAKKSNPTGPIRAGVQLLSKHIGKKIAGIIPVEIGAQAVAAACYLATILDVPLIDADFVGGRSTPEVFLETITLFNLSRTPAVVINNQKEAAILLSATTPLQQEKFFRDFSVMSGGQAYVIGYPLTKKILMTSIEHGTVSDAITIGECFRTKKEQKLYDTFHMKDIFLGRITAIEQKSTRGFSEIILTIKEKGVIASLYIKNENLLCWVNKKLVVSCPDLIMLLDAAGMPIYNSSLKKGQVVRIVAMLARPLWRTKKGLRLFNPKTFGFSMEAKLLTD